MAIQQTEKIWHNGKLIPWDDAHIHVMSHVVNYGSSVFEGIRCYALPSGPAIFRANEHMQRLVDSAKIYRIDLDYTPKESRSTPKVISARDRVRMYSSSAMGRCRRRLSATPCFQASRVTQRCKLPAISASKLSNRESRVKCCISLTRLFSPAPPPRLLPSAPLTRSTSAKA